MERHAGHGDADDGFERRALGADRAPARPGGRRAGRSGGVDGAGCAAGSRDRRRVGPSGCNAELDALSFVARVALVGTFVGAVVHAAIVPTHWGDARATAILFVGERGRLRAGLLVDVHVAAALAARRGRHARGDGLRLRPLHRAGLGDDGPGRSRDDHRRGGGGPGRALARRLARPGPAARRRAGGIAGGHALATGDERDRRDDGDRAAASSAGVVVRRIGSERPPRLWPACRAPDRPGRGGDRALHADHFSGGEHRVAPTTCPR